MARKAPRPPKPDGVKANPRIIKKRRRRTRRKHSELEESKAIRLFNEMMKLDDRGVAILGTNLLENHLAVAVAARLRKLSAPDHNLIFKGENAALGRFHAKIQIGYALNMYGKDEYRELMTIKAIRNQFAHDLHVRSFNIPSIKRECVKLLSSDYMRWMESSVKVAGIEPMPQVRQFREMFIWAIVSMDTKMGTWAKRGTHPSREGWFSFRHPSFQAWLRKHAPRHLPQIQTPRRTHTKPQRPPASSQE